MLQLIRNALEQENVAVWQIRKTETRRAELYFIKKKLDIPRLAVMNEYQVSVYRDFEENGQKYRGMSVMYAEEGQTEKQIREKVRNAYFAAQYVKNPYYDLPDPVREAKQESKSDLAGRDLQETANAFADAVLDVPDDGEAFVNSLEIFAIRSEVTLVSSAGTNVCYETNKVEGEFVTQCVRPVDVEQYRQFAYDSFDTQALKDKVASAVADVRMRANATDMPKTGKHDILLTGENLKIFFEYYLIRANASVIFPGYSTWKTGDRVQEAGTGEKLNIDLLATEPYSVDGVPMKDMVLTEDGVLRNIWGATRFMRYLNETPTGSYEKIRVKNGTVPFEQMKTEGTLETVSFSDFQMDYFTGNFGGEMRLALMKKDGKDIPLYGGSVNAKISDCADRLVFSTERYEDSGYSGPYAVLIPGVAVAGE
ncbi:MAG: metallopeptidase TldD-related protein [Clostridia bacterium]|nr:metallopeptidase TldD-related protein [Clostridia bacterium]